MFIFKPWRLGLIQFRTRRDRAHRQGHRDPGNRAATDFLQQRYRFRLRLDIELATQDPDKSFRLRGGLVRAAVPGVQQKRQPLPVLAQGIQGDQPLRRCERVRTMLQRIAGPCVALEHRSLDSLIRLRWSWSHSSNGSSSRKKPWRSGPCTRETARRISAISGDAEIASSSTTSAHHELGSNRMMSVSVEMMPGGNSLRNDVKA